MKPAPFAGRRQRGTAAVEFALVASVFFIALFGAMEMARLLFVWNTTAEATRLGARIAIVCDKAGATDTAIKTRMKALVPQLTDAEISITYLPTSSCTASSDCTGATVSIAATTPISTFIPGVPLSVTLPAFTTTLSRESMASTIPTTGSIIGGVNPMCS